MHPQPSATSPHASTAKTSYVVLADKGASAKALAAKLRSSGATVTSVNDAIGLVTVTSTTSGFATKTRRLAHVAGVAADRSIGYTPERHRAEGRRRERSRAGEDAAASRSTRQKGPAGGDPLDSQLWGMDMINAVQAHAVNRGDHRVTVGVLDTGIQADHPDLQLELQQEALAQLHHRHAGHRRRRV